MTPHEGGGAFERPAESSKPPVPTPVRKRGRTPGQTRGRGLTKRAQRERSIEDLCESALGLFVTQGYHGTTVEQIATAAGLTKGAVYFYFKSKAGVLDRLLDRFEALILEPTVVAVEEAGPSATDRLVAFMHAQSMVGAQRAELMLLGIMMPIEFHGSVEPIGSRLGAQRARLEALLADTVERGRARGEFRADLGGEATVGMILAVNQGCLMEWYRSRTRLDGPALVRAMRSIVLEGLAARPVVPVANL